MALTPIAGKDIDLLVEKDGDYVIFGCIRSATLNMGADTLDASCKGSGGWAESISGTKNWSIDAEGVYRKVTAPDDADNLSFDELIAAWKAGETVGVRFGVGTTGSVMQAGTAIITSLSIDAPNDAEATASVTLQGTGALTTYTVPA